MKTKAVIIIFFIIACISAYARPRYSFTNYTRDNGTGQMVVQDILQDNNGYLWLAAWSGLHRFNGSSFTDYRVEGTDDNGNQASNHFLDIENDAFGRIWVLAYDKRLYRFDPHESSMTTADDGMKMEGMFRLASDDFIFLSSDNVLFRTDYGKGGRDCAIVRYLELAPDTEVNGALKDIYDNVWVLTDKGLYRNRQLVNERPALCFEELDNAIYFGSTDGKIVEYIEGKEFLLDTYTDYEIRLIANVPGTLEFIVGSSTDGLIALNFEGWTSTPVKWESYRDGKLRAIKDDESNVWIYSERGSLDWYDSSLKELVPFYDKKRQKEWNSERYVHSAFSDNQGNIWFSPSYGGIERAVLNTENFRLETITNTSAISPENSVRAIYLDKGIKYVATKDGKVRLYNDQWATLAVWNTIDPVYSITKTKDGTVWLGTKGGGLIENRSGAYNLTAYHPERYRKNDLLFYSVNGDLIYHLNSEDEDRLWIGSFDGSIYYLDLGKDRRDFISKKNLISFPTDQLNRVRHICFGPNGSLYAGGTLGLFILDAPTTAPQDMQFKSFPSVKGYNIHHIMFSRSGQMYASSFGNGFLHFHSTDSGSGVTAYTTNEGLLSNYVYSAIEDKHGNIWLATHGGLNRLNPDTGSIIGFPYERIGVNLIFNEGDPAMSEDGEIFFNTNAGLLHFNPDEISNSPFVPKIHVSSCRVSGERHDIRDDEPITINNRDKLSLRISAIDLTAPERVLVSSTG